MKPSDKTHLLLLGPDKPLITEGLAESFIIHRLDSSGTLASGIASSIRAIALCGGHDPLNAEFMLRFPNLEIIANFGVGYDHIDATWAGEHGIIVTNTPDVLTEEVADTALGLLLCTVRELPQAERYLRAGRWLEKPYPLTCSSLRGRSVGIVGLGRIGSAIARRLEGFGVSLSYHNRNKRDVHYIYHASLLSLAREVDILIVVTPGGPETSSLVNFEILGALGPCGILINIGRGSSVDEAALIRALKTKTILAAGLDVFNDEPHVPKELLEMGNVVLLPHVGSASMETRDAMARLLVNNLLSWKNGKGALTPVKETPAS
jgi:lactate dehydrogenase-like 2-hydroxyacid dehydrogenase